MRKVLIGAGVVLALFASSATSPGWQNGAKPVGCDRFRESEPPRFISGSPGAKLLRRLRVLRRPARARDRFPEDLDWQPSVSCFYGRYIRVVRKLRDGPMLVVVPAVLPRPWRTRGSGSRGLVLAETRTRDFEGPASGSCCVTADQLTKNPHYRANLDERDRSGHRTRVEGLVPDGVSKVVLRIGRGRWSARPRNNFFIARVPMSPNKAICGRVSWISHDGGVIRRGRKPGCDPRVGV